MKIKKLLRKKFLSLRKKKYFDVPISRFQPLINYIKKKYKLKKRIFLAIYYPSNYEINLIKVFDNLKEKKIITLLPIITKNGLLNFVEWKPQDIMIVNKYGIPEPLKTNKKFLPDVVLVPLLSYDKYKNRLGYGKGYYDKYLNNLIKLNKKIEAIGIAFSFQKYVKLPTNKFDFNLNHIFTDKGFIQ